MMCSQLFEEVWSITRQSSGRAQSWSRIVTELRPSLPGPRAASSRALRVSSWVLIAYRARAIGSSAGSEVFIGLSERRGYWIQAPLPATARDGFTGIYRKGVLGQRS